MESKHDKRFVVSYYSQKLPAIKTAKAPGSRPGLSLFDEHIIENDLIPSEFINK